MTVTERFAAERDFHDRQALTRRADLARRGLAFRDDDYLDHESWIRPAIVQLGDLRGRCLLDFGCGHGMASVVLARRGACVTAFDLAGNYLQEAADRAFANGVSIDCVQANGEFLPFADHSFDAVWGNAVLHHLDAHRAGRELWRVLKPAGVAVFCEPWGGNPLLRWARRHLPYPQKQRTIDEAPLESSQLEVLRSIFPGVQVRGHQFLSMVRRLAPNLSLFYRLQKWDAHLLQFIPALERYCRYVTIILKKSVCPSYL